MVVTPSPISTERSCKSPSTNVKDFPGQKKVEEKLLGEILTI